jgi:predicted nucleic acid binding AN1-type Zn finger protein
MASRNDVTGDLIKSRKNSKEFEDNFDKIFRKNKDPLCDVCGKSLTATKECAFTGCPLNWDEARCDVIGQNGPTGDHY